MIRFVMTAAVALWGFAAQAEIEIEEVTSPGGITAWLVEEPSIPFVAIEIRIVGGASLDRPGKRGAINLMTGLLEEGSGELDTREFQAAREGLAASFGYDVGDDLFSLSFQALTENRDEALALFRASIIDPTFDPVAVERVRAQVIAGIESEAQRPNSIAGERFFADAFAGHPYGSDYSGTIESVSALTRDDLVQAHRDVLVRDGIFVGAVGDITAEELGVALDALLGDLPSLEELGYETNGGWIDVVEFHAERLKSLREQLRDTQAAQTALAEETEGAEASDLNDLRQQQIELQERRAILARQLEQLEEINEATSPEASEVSPEARQLAALQDELEAALLTLSETNPRVVRLREQVEQLSAIVEAQNGEETSTTPVIEVRLAELGAQLDELDAQHAVIQGRIDAIPANSIRQSTLEREGEALAAEIEAVTEALGDAIVANRGPIDTGFGLPGGVTVVDYPTPQSVALFGHEGMARDDEDFFAAYILNHILGAGGFESRLMQEVREERGLTYGIATYLVPKEHAAMVLGSVASSNGTIAEAIEVIRAEWARMATEGVTAEELEAAKTYLTGEYPLRFDGNGPIADIMVGMQVQGLPRDYVVNRNDYVNAVTLEEVNRVAAELLDAEALHFTVVGQPEGLEATQ